MDAQLFWLQLQLARERERKVFFFLENPILYVEVL